jgi:hypothetical protein
MPALSNSELFDAARTAIGIVIDRLPCADTEQAIMIASGALAAVVDRALRIGFDDARLLAQLHGSIALARKGNATLIDDMDAIGKA